ncbi:MAG TPA: M14 family zinc carboxypeptidase, partial [Anaerolineae bacterium]|nr:M14 family zinc carboxypeptidase [Anaerolineae bacterium]
MDIRFDTYYRYNALVEILKSLAAEYPQLMRLESIGRSYEGRDIWLAAITNLETGGDRQKPALWVDGNIHASEIS